MPGQRMQLFLQRPIQRLPEELLGRNRVTFDTQLSPASLKIRNVSEEDAGLYRSHITRV